MNNDDQNPWRPLEPGEIIQEGDEASFRQDTTPKWTELGGAHGWNTVGKCPEDFASVTFRTRRPRPAPLVNNVWTSTPPCSDHPDAPHGFDRDGSHTAGRYVCDCEGWIPPQDSAPAEPSTMQAPATSEAGEGAGGGDSLQTELIKARQRIAELEKGITEIKAGTRIGWFMTDLGAKCSKLLNK